MSAFGFDVFNCRLEGASLIEASAGTGKTWNICWLYLRLLLERGLDVRQILVVTFTKAATAELRERIRSRIVDVLLSLENREPCDPHAGKFISVLKERGIAADFMQKRLDEALQSFDEAAILTIHGFCQRALAGSAFSAGQSFALEVIEDDAELITEVVHDFWRRRIAGGDICPALADWLARKRIEPSRLVPLLKRALAKPMAETIWPDGADMRRDIDLEPLVRTHEAARTCWNEYREQAIGMLLAAAQSGDVSRQSYSETAVANGAAALDQYLSGNDALAGIPNHAVLYRTTNLSRRTNKNGTAPKHLVFDLLDELFGLREQAEHALDLAYLGLIRELHDQAAVARMRKKELRIQSYDDILFNLYDALTSGNYPWLAASLRQDYRAALIDEFQDTDPLQYEIFDAVYGTAECPVFFVGDPKQAIYSFRNADLNVYLKAGQKTSARHTLQHNQRSTEGLIEALNTLFGANPKTFMQPGLDYVPVSVGDKPRMSFQDRSAIPSDLQIWMLPKDDKGQPIERPAAVQAAASATAGEIARLLDASSRNEIMIGDRPLIAGDIAVLVRSHAQGRIVRQALNARGIGSVELSQQSVFDSLDAEELERVLGAILMPARESQLRAALATELIGLDASAIAAIDDADALATWMERFVHYRDSWLTHGIGIMLRELMSSEGICARMLCRQDGERRLTNLLHLAELLHRASTTQDSPETLLRWLASRRREAARTEESQLRLESDRNLVQIVTVHKSKGLEYPVVFCPFLWIGGQRKLAGGSYEYHDDEGRAVIDWRLLSDAEETEVQRRVRQEESAETLRLIYVALTRAIYRCYLVAGIYNRKHGKNLSTSESRRSLLNWLIAGGSTDPEQWPAHKLEPAAVEQAWHALQAKCPGSIALLPLSSVEGVAIDSGDKFPDLRFPDKLPPFLSSGWRIGSFSGLMLGTSSEVAASEHDAHFPGPIPPDDSETIPDPDDILLFPRGANAGNCMHAAFELSDFTDPSGWEAGVDKALMLHPQEAGSLKNLSEDMRLARMKAMMLRMMGDVTTTPLQNDIVLNQIGSERRLTELEFFVPAFDVAADALHDLLNSLGYEVPRLNAARLRGYLKGFIDLVFEHGGRYYILDWKSNHLGHAPADYKEQSMAQAMSSHGYHLQYLLYTVALNRYLARRVSGYDYDRHFGGVLYLFVRGVRPAWKDEDGNPCGSYFHRPDRDVIEKLDAALSGANDVHAPFRIDSERLTAC